MAELFGVVAEPLGVLTYFQPHLTISRTLFQGATTTSSLMKPSCLLIRRFNQRISRCIHRRKLLTLAIESSCDDTSVAVLEKHRDNSATLHFHSKITSDNRSYGGVYPIVAHESHQRNLATLVNEALQNLPIQRSAIAHFGNALLIKGEHGTELRMKPDFVTATRGPGMRASLITGVDTAKGLAVAWQVPFLGVNHMQAHALTPRMVSALDADRDSSPSSSGTRPAFPFLTLLVSGGHTMLVYSCSLCDHVILANTADIAIGDMIDKCARDILPKDLLESSSSVMYGPILEEFAFPEKAINYEYHAPSNINSLREAHNTGYSWRLSHPYSQRGPGGSWMHANLFSYSGIGSSAKGIIQQRPNMEDAERRVLAREIMRAAFEHLASRVLLALENTEMKAINTLVVSGGVASNQYLKHVLRANLDAQEHQDMKLVFPPPKFCTDNAAMIAWAGIEMYEAGWRTELDALAIRKWSIDHMAEDGGILGIGGWKKAAPE